MASNAATITLEQLMASQYVSAAGLVILLWDHMLTFADEVNLIWAANFSIPKLLFLFNRYVVPFALIFQTHEFSGIAAPYISTTLCKIGYGGATILGILSIATSNFLVLLRLWVLWDRSRRLMYGTLALYIATQLVALSLTIWFLTQEIPTISFNLALHICTPSTKPNFVLLWSPGIVFEFMTFVTTFWNAVDRPRPVDERMAKVMYRDGSIYFIGLFALRLTNLLLSVLAPPSLAFLGVFFIWSVSNITLARLILNLRRLALTSHNDEDTYVAIPVLRNDHRASRSQSFELQKLPI